VHVIAVDRDPQAVGFVLADERAIISSEDEEAVDRLARAREVHGIVSPGADWPVGIAARVAERIGLSHTITARTGSIVTSKARQREAFAEAGVPHARELDPRQGELRFPLVVKAPDRQGQRGLGLVYSPGELEAALVTAIAESRGGAVLVEEHVEGPEVTVNAVSVDGRFMPLTVTDRLTAEPPAFGVALAHVWRSSLEPGTLGAAVEATSSAAAALGVLEGPTYTQVRVGPDGPSVVELGARLGGGHDAELCRAALGIDLNALSLAAALGEEIPTRALVPVERAGGACVRFLVAPPGELRGIEGEEEACAIEGVLDVRVYRRPGHVFGELRRASDRAGAVIAVGDSREEALERADRSAECIRFDTADVEAVAS
jgi:biotin carboxylase